MAECIGEYAEYYADAYCESGNPESFARSRIGWRQTGFPDLGSNHPQAGSPGKGGDGTLYWPDVFHGPDGVPAI